MLAKLKAALLAPFTDSRWAQIVLKQGVWLLVPIVGYVALLGWQRRVFEAARNGDHKLPPPGLGENLSAGWTSFFAVVLMFLVPVGLVLLLIGLPAELLHVRIGKWLPREIFQVPIVAFFFCAYVEVMRRALTANEKAAILKPAASIRAIRAAPAAYFAIVGAMVGAYIVATCGLYVCLIGIFVSAPMGHAMAAHLLVLWDRESSQRQVQ